MSGGRLVFILVLLGVVLIASGNSSEITKDRHKKASNQGGKIPATNFDKCKDANPPCEARQDKCFGVKGSDQYECFCHEGFYTHPYKEDICIDINQCRSDNSIFCLGYDICTNTNGSYICSCKEGYDYKKGDGCQDINECKTGAHKCDTNTSKCVNRVGSHTCKCLEGFEKKQDKCVDIDECEQEDLCGDKNITACTNTIGSYTCTCKDSGYGWESKTCEDIDECTNGAHKCDLTSSKCKNKKGSHECVCIEGYKMKNEKCVDIDECTNGAHKCNMTSSKCKNKNGGYDCPCRKGYKMKNDKCVDLDGCKLRTHNCTKQSYCRNTAGSFRCICPTGYKRNSDGRSCHKKSNPSSGASIGIIVAAVGLPVAFLSVLITILARKRWLRKPGLEGQKGSEDITDIKDTVLVSQNESTPGENVENVTCQE